MAIAAVITLMGALVSTGTAQAWDQYPCKAGQLHAEAGGMGPLGPDVSVPGEVECVVSVYGPQFAVAVFEVGRDYGYYHADLLSNYQSSGTKTTFDVTGRIMIREKVVDTGLCIMPDPNTRLSCVLFSTKTMTVVSLPTSDPLVTKAVRDTTGTDTEPNCGTCWRVTS